MRNRLLFTFLMLFGWISNPLADTADFYFSENALERSKLTPVECWYSAQDIAKVVLGSSATQESLNAYREKHKIKLASVECFQMFVPENVEKPDGKLISFAISRIRLGETDNKNKIQLNPILHLGGGGPGNPANFEHIYRSISLTLGENRDIYIIDPRGTGISQPVLTCGEYVTDFLKGLNSVLEPEEIVRNDIKRHKHCFKGLAEKGVDVGTYNSFSISTDIELLRRALGVNKWNLLGVSYGARYAITIAQRYPQSVESLALVSTTFPTGNNYENLPMNYQRMFDAMIHNCLIDKYCGQIIENLEQRFWQLIRTLKENPLEVSVMHPTDTERITVMLNDTHFLWALLWRFFYTTNITDLSSIVWNLEQQTPDYFEDSLKYWIYQNSIKNYGVVSAWAHFCSENAPIVNFKKARENAMSVRKELQQELIMINEYDRNFCHDISYPWRVLDNQLTNINIPTLFLHGGLDPYLPASEIDNNLHFFSHAAKVIFPKSGHFAMGHPCAIYLLGSFYKYKMKFREHLKCSGYRLDGNLMTHM